MLIRSGLLYIYLGPQSPERVLEGRMKGFRLGTVDTVSGHLVSGSNRAINCDLKQMQTPLGHHFLLKRRIWDSALGLHCPGDQTALNSPTPLLLQRQSIACAYVGYFPHYFRELITRTHMYLRVCFF